MLGTFSLEEALRRAASSPGPALGLDEGQDRYKSKHKHEMFVKPISEGSKLLVRECFSNSHAGTLQGLQRKSSTATGEEKGLRILTCTKCSQGLFSHGISSGCCLLSKTF